MHATIFSMLPLFAAQRVGDLKYMGRAGPGEGSGGIGGSGREGEGKLLNSIVVEALAGNVNLKANAIWNFVFP